MNQLVKFSVLIMCLFTLVAFSKPKITFIELGSVRCVPCRQMQPVMDSIRTKYSGVVEVVFYDVWTKEQKNKAKEYKIRVIPTQVFLDENGKEIHRHEGYYPLEEIEKFLKSKGIKPKRNK